MNAPSWNDLRTLLGVERRPCVSLYLPTHPAGIDDPQDALRLKNLTEQAREGLERAGLRAPEARDFVQPLRDFPKDPALWDARGEGLALFLAPEFFQAYRLARPVEELVAVDRRFRVRPLLPHIEEARYFLLALSRNEVRLFEGDARQLTPLDLPELPPSLRDTLRRTGADRGEQVHAGDVSRRGKQGAVFHGQGGKPDTNKEELLQYFHRVSAALEPRFTAAQLPILPAGVEYLLPIYRAVSRAPRLLEAELVGSVEGLTPAELHARAWPLLVPYFQRERREATEHIRALTETGRASIELPAVLNAAHGGRVDTLLVDLAAHAWGTVEHGGGDIYRHAEPLPGDTELYDHAVAEVLLHGGRVFALPTEEMPPGTVIAATLRY